MADEAMFERTMIDEYAVAAYNAYKRWEDDWLMFMGWVHYYRWFLNQGLSIQEMFL